MLDGEELALLAHGYHKYFLISYDCPKCGSCGSEQAFRLTGVSIALAAVRFKDAQTPGGFSAMMKLAPEVPEDPLISSGGNIPRFRVVPQ